MLQTLIMKQLHLVRALLQVLMLEPAVMDAL